MDAIWVICLKMTAWQWMSLGIALLAFELMFPGLFLLWFGLSALITAVLVYLLGLPSVVAIGIFLIAGVALSFFISKKQNAGAQFLVNDSINKMVGKVIVLDEAIVNGRGRVKIADSHWTVTGPNFAGGSRVKVVEVQAGPTHEN